MFFFVFFYNDTATTEIYTLSLHDALPIYCATTRSNSPFTARRKTESPGSGPVTSIPLRRAASIAGRSEEHTSELQSHVNLVCRLLLEKKKNKSKTMVTKNLMC